MVVSKFNNRSFYTRLISGIILVIIALVTIITGGDVLLATLIMISVEGLREFNRVFKNDKNIIGVFTYLFTIAYYILIRYGHFDYLGPVTVGLLMLIMTVYVIRYPKVKTEAVLSAVFGFVYVAVMLSFIYIIRMNDNGLYNVWLIFLCSWGCDTCAYVFGVAFGKHKMAPVLSPKKTIEGAVGGIFGAALLGVIFASVFQSHIKMEIDPRIGYAIVCALGSLVSMIGDLAASAVKREYNIKDYSSLIPGHGGILDRFDSVIFVAPVIALLTYCVNKGLPW